mgnify:CR=1 FL=1
MISTVTIIIWFMYLVSLYLIIFWLLVLIDKKPRNRDKLKMYHNVTITIPAYNEEHTIRRTLDSVFNLNYPRNKLEIIVVNDGSIDDTRKIVENIIRKRKDFDIKLINKKNGGKGSALNSGLKIAKGHFFTCLDADSYVRRDALLKMLPYFDDKEVGAVLPLMKVHRPETVLQKIQWIEYIVNLFYKSIMSIVNCVHVAPGPFSVYRKDILERLNGFDEKNLTEDLEISLRLQKENYKILQAMDTEVYTFVPKDFKAFYRQRNRWYKGTILNLFKHRTLIGNKKYGDFGLIQMPRVAISGVLAVSALFITFYHFIIVPLAKKFYDLSFIDFNLGFNISRYIKDFTFLSFNYTNLFFALISFTLGAIILIYAHRATRESFFKYGYFSVPVYLISYGLLASLIWLGVFIELIFGRVQKW